MMSNKQDWNVVDWSKIPEDVEAVVTFEHMTPNYYKTVNGVLVIRDAKDTKFETSLCNDVLEVQGSYGNRFHLRPELPESTQVENSQVAVTNIPEFDWSTVDDDVEVVVLYNGVCVNKYKQFIGGLYCKGIVDREWYKSMYVDFEELTESFEGSEGVLLMRPFNPSNNKKSIQSILSDAQELIKKHYNLTGEVKFTIKCQ